MDNLEKKALAYHEADGVPGKISVVPTKPCRTADDLALAYTPGVAKPVLKIDGDKLDAFAKVRTMSQAKETMLAAIQDCLNNRLSDPEAENSYIMIAHTQNEAMAQEFMQEAKERWPKADFYMAPLALAIACHTGPGALAIVAERKLRELPHT